MCILTKKTTTTELLQQCFYTSTLSKFGVLFVLVFKKLLLLTAVYTFKKFSKVHSLVLRYSLFVDRDPTDCMFQVKQRKYLLNYHGNVLLIYLGELRLKTTISFHFTKYSMDFPGFLSLFLKPVEISNLLPVLLSLKE